MSCDGGFPVSLYLLSPASVSSVQCENTTLSCQPPLAVYFGPPVWLRIVICMPAIPEGCCNFVIAVLHIKENGLERVAGVMCDLSISYNERRDGGTEENAGGRELQQVAEIQILGACLGGSGLRTSE